MLFVSSWIHTATTKKQHIVEQKVFLNVESIKSKLSYHMPERLNNVVAGYIDTLHAQ